MDKILSIDIGGTTLKYTIISKGKAIFKEKYINTYNINVAKLIDIIKDIYNHYDNLTGLAIASPGAVEKNRYINFWTAIEGLSQGFDFVKALNNIGINIPITIINDANAAAYGEYIHGAAKGTSSMAFIGIGSGIGGAAIVKNTLIEGSKGFGGEFGSAFQIWNQKTNQYESPQDNGAFHGIIRKFKAKKIDIDGEGIFDLYDQQDKFATDVINDMYSSIVRTLWVIALTINPEVVVLGGGIINRKQFKEEISQRFNEFASKLGINKPLFKIRVTKIKNMAPIYGAYEYHMNIIKNKER